MTDRHEAALRAALAERDRLHRQRVGDPVSQWPIASDYTVTRIVEAALAAADAYDGAREVLYAVRRADGSDIGEYSFVVGGPNDWTPAEDDADGIDDQTEYQIVKMTVEVVGRRVLPECSDSHCTEPATHWGLCEQHAREDDPEYFVDEGRDQCTNTKS